MHVFNSTTWRAETGSQQVQCHPEFHCEKSKTGQGGREETEKMGVGIVREYENVLSVVFCSEKAVSINEAL